MCLLQIIVDTIHNVESEWYKNTKYLYLLSQNQISKVKKQKKKTNKPKFKTTYMKIKKYWLKILKHC